MSGTWCKDGFEHNWLPDPVTRDWEICTKCEERRHNPFVEGPLEPTA